MLDTQSVSRAGVTGGGLSGPLPNPGTDLEKDDFLRLMITQLRNQDPLNPLDQNQFLAQTAQFASLEQLMSINRGLEELKGASGSSSLAQAASLLGKTATVSGLGFDYDGVSPASLPFSIRRAGGQVTVEIVDREGKLLRRIAVGPREVGDYTVTWDGLDDQGRRIGAGSYFYRVSAVGAGGGGSPLAVAAEGLLTGFERQGAQLFFRMGDRLVRQEDLVEVRDPTEPAAAATAGPADVPAVA